MAFVLKLSILDLSFGVDLVHALHVSASIDDGCPLAHTFELLAVHFSSGGSIHLRLVDE